MTRGDYGRCGQRSIDPVVFFKLCLMGYLENISSDRRLIEHCSLSLDLLYFMGFQFDEQLPWHSTLSRTHQLLQLLGGRGLGISLLPLKWLSEQFLR